MPNLTDPTLPARTDFPADLYVLERAHQLDLDEARRIQRATLPEYPLRAGPVSVLHEFQPVVDVGGDFLDYFTLPDGTVGLYIGDVCGKGLPAALYAALTVGILRGIHKTGQGTSGVLSVLNRRMTLRGVSGRYAAMQYAVFDPASGLMDITSAGMHGPFHISQDVCQMLEMSGVPPGLFPDAAYESLTLHLAPGDSVVFCTDGIIEAMNPGDDFFGPERLVELCSMIASQVPGSELAEYVFAAVGSFTEGRRQHDDMAVMVLYYSGVEP